jgi:hypothetical protein
VKVEHCVSDLVKLKEELGSAAQELKGLISETEDGLKGYMVNMTPNWMLLDVCVSPCQRIRKRIHYV